VGLAVSCNSTLPSLQMGLVSRGVRIFLLHAYTSSADSVVHGGHVPPLLQIVGYGDNMSRRTANKKLTKLYWPPRKRPPKRLIVLAKPKRRVMTKNTPPTFEFVPVPLTPMPSCTHLTY